MAEDTSYITKVYHEQGGDRYVAGSDGEIIAESGGQITVASGANLGLGGSELGGTTLRQMLVSNPIPVLIATGAVSDVFSVVNQPKNVRMVNFSMTSTIVSASFWLTSCSAGAEVYLTVFPGSTLSGQIDVSLSGCTLLDSVGVPISGFMMFNSGSTISAPKIHLIAPKENVWSVVAQGGDINT